MNNIDKIINHTMDYDLITIDNFDDAIIGVCYSIDKSQSILYDKSIIINSLMGGGMEYEEAIEYFEFNIAGAYVGDKTPVFYEGLKDM